MKHKYDRSLVAPLVLEAMHNGESLRQSCIMAGVPVSTFLLWVSEDKALAEQYTHAREALIDCIADELMRITDEPVGSDDNGRTDGAAVQKQRLQVDTRKWLLSKLAPKKYGEKVEQTIVGDAEKPLIINFVEPPVRDDDH